MRITAILENLYSSSEIERVLLQYYIPVAMRMPRNLTHVWT